MFKADLHIHTCLSPCAELEMSPRNIVQRACERGLDIIAICDHNSGENAPYTSRSAENTDLTVTYGMEITSMEEVHILALFENKQTMLSMQSLVYEHLQGVNIDDLYGDQVVVNEHDEIMGFNQRLLIGATGLTVERIVHEIHELGGIAIAAHIDRESFSILSQLGFVPEGLNLDAFEISAPERLEEYGDDYQPLVSFSDAHTLEGIGSSYTKFYMEAANLTEMGKALHGEQGRGVFI